MSWKTLHVRVFMLAALALPSLPACPFKRGGGGEANSSSGGPIAPKRPDEIPIKPSPQVMATGHPRLFVRDQDIPRLRSWATVQNPMFEKGLKPLVEQLTQTADTPTFFTDDPGMGHGYAPAPVEGYAMVFAFYSMVAPSEAERAEYAKRAKKLLMFAIDKAVKGPADDQPFREPRFAIDDRSRFTGMAFPLTVDWIYSSLGPEDKKKIRTVFLRWANELQHAETTTFNHPEPVGVTNDPKLLADKLRVRWAGNNYYCAHARNLALMAMALDAADDPDEKLRSYVPIVTGAWLYVSDALMRGDMRGGLAAEGFEYSPLSVGYIAQTLLALYTAGRADPNIAGKQVSFDANPFWNDAIAGFLHSLSPVARPAPADSDVAHLGLIHQVAWYGDGERYYAPDFMGVFGPLGVYDEYTHNEKRLANLRWIETNFAPGGSEKLTDRAADNNDLLGALFYFLMFDPRAAPPVDPRPQVPLTFFADGIGRFLQRTSWKEDASWFSYKLGWTNLDHQGADGNMFELWRKGEWLTKERTGYGDDAACTDQKNGVALQNDKPFHNDGYRGVEWKRGSQWTYVTNGDGKILASRWGPDFSYFLGDATQLYNSKDENSEDIVHASRSIVWIVPDRVVTYDRAQSKKDKRFKRFWMQLPSSGSVSGNLMTMRSAGGQNLFVRTLLPTPATMAVEPAEKLDDDRGKQPAMLDPIRYRFRVEAPGSPKSIRWLHVIQGADGKARADDASLVNATGATPYQGAAFNDTVVMFPVDIGAFKEMTYTAPASTKAHLVTGLAPNAGYRVTQKREGSGITITVTAGGDQKADRGGVLTIGKLP